MLLKWVTLSVDKLQMIAVINHFNTAMCLNGFGCFLTGTAVSFGIEETWDYTQQRTDLFGSEITEQTIICIFVSKLQIH